MTAQENNHHANISIETRGGRMFHYFGESLDEIDIHDIAAALSKMCRFVGHCRRFYSVAEHSVYVSRIVPEEFAMAGLLHDASEAYLSDMASPIKKQMPEYKKIEHGIMEKVAKKFVMPELFWESPEIKKADMDMLRTEAYALFDGKGLNWGIPDGDVWTGEIRCYNPDAAQMLFLARYRELV